MKQDLQFLGTHTPGFPSPSSIFFPGSASQQTNTEAWGSLSVFSHYLTQYNDFQHHLYADNAQELCL